MLQPALDDGIIFARSSATCSMDVRLGPGQAGVEVFGGVALIGLLVLRHPEAMSERP